MEFVAFADAWRELEDGGVVPRDDGVPSPPPPPGVLATLDLTLDEVAEAMSLADSRPAVPLERRAEAVEQVLHKLRLSPVVILPRTRWRHVLDAVTFTLAEHRAWQELESETTLVLNTRDALVCGPADLKAVRLLVEAVFADGRGPDDSIHLLPPSGRLLLTVAPGGEVKVEVATPALAAWVRELLASFA